MCVLWLWLYMGWLSAKLLLTICFLECWTNITNERFLLSVPKWNINKIIIFIYGFNAGDDGSNLKRKRLTQKIKERHNKVAKVWSFFLSLAYIYLTVREDLYHLLKSCYKWCVVPLSFIFFSSFIVVLHFVYFLLWQIMIQSKQIHSLSIDLSIQPKNENKIKEYILTLVSCTVCVLTYWIVHILLEIW